MQEDSEMRLLCEEILRNQQDLGRKMNHLLEAAPELLQALGNERVRSQVKEQHRRMAAHAAKISNGKS